MKKFKSLIGIMALSLFVACNEDVEVTEDSQVVESTKVTINAKLDPIYVTDGSRTVLNGDGSVWWKPLDEIGVFFGTYGKVYTAYNTKPAPSAMFVGDALIITGNNENSSGITDEYTYWGVFPAYPYGEDGSFEEVEYGDGNFAYYKNYFTTIPGSTGDAVRASLPSYQQGIAGTFDEDLFISVAKSTDYRELSFYNLCGGVRFCVQNAGINKVTFRGNNNEVLAGNMAIVVGEDNIPVVAEVTHARTIITMALPEGKYFEPGEWYYIVTLPTVLDSGYTMNFYTDKTFATYTTSESVEIKRSTFGTLTNPDAGVTFSEIVYPEYIEIKDLGVFNCNDDNRYATLGLVMNESYQLDVKVYPENCSFPVEFMPDYDGYEGWHDNTYYAEEHIALYKHQQSYQCTQEGLVKINSKLNHDYGYYVHLWIGDYQFHIDLDAYSDNSVHSIKINGAEGSYSTNYMWVGDTMQLYASVMPVTSDAKIEWSSSCPEAFSVDQNGVVRCIDNPEKYGDYSVEIIARAGDVTDNTHVQMLEPTVYFSPDSIHSIDAYFVGSVHQLKAYVKYNDFDIEKYGAPQNPDTTIRYFSSDTTIAKIDEMTGVLTFVAPGHCEYIDRVVAECAGVRAYYDFNNDVIYPKLVGDIVGISWGAMIGPAKVNVGDTVKVTADIPEIRWIEDPSVLPVVKWIAYDDYNNKLFEEGYVKNIETNGYIGLVTFLKPAVGRLIPIFEGQNYDDYDFRNEGVDFVAEIDSFINKGDYYYDSFDVPITVDVDGAGCPQTTKFSIPTRDLRNIGFLLIDNYAGTETEFYQALSEGVVQYAGLNPNADYEEWKPYMEDGIVIPSTTSSPYGHWYNTALEPVSWSNPDPHDQGAEHLCYIGGDGINYTIDFQGGVVNAGSNYYMWALYYNKEGKRAAVVRYCVSVAEKPEFIMPDPDYMIELVVPVDNNYGNTYFSLDGTDVTEMGTFVNSELYENTIMGMSYDLTSDIEMSLGIEDGTLEDYINAGEVLMGAYDSEGNFMDCYEYRTSNNFFWYDENGRVANWGSSARLAIDEFGFHSDAVKLFGSCFFFPKQVSIGEQHISHIIFKYADAEFVVQINALAVDAPEEKGLELTIVDTYDRIYSAVNPGAYTTPSQNFSIEDIIGEIQTLIGGEVTQILMSSSDVNGETTFHDWTFSDGWFAANGAAGWGAESEMFCMMPQIDGTFLYCAAINDGPCNAAVTFRYCNENTLKAVDVNVTVALTDGNAGNDDETFEFSPAWEIVNVDAAGETSFSATVNCPAGYTLVKYDYTEYGMSHIYSDLQGFWCNVEDDKAGNIKVSFESNGAETARKAFLFVMPTSAYEALNDDVDGFFVADRNADVWEMNTSAAAQYLIAEFIQEGNR